MPVVGAALLLTMNRTLASVHVEPNAVGAIKRLGLPQRLPVQRHQPDQILFPGQQFGLEPVQGLGQRRAPVTDPRRADQSERRVGCGSFGVVEVLVARQAAVDRLPQQIRQRELLIQALSRAAQLFLDEFLQTQSLIQLAGQNQATIGSHSRSLEIDLQGSIERELKWLILFLTHWVLTSRASSSRSHRHEY